MDFGKPILMTGGGGYNVSNTVRAWASARSVLCGADAKKNNATAGMRGVMLENVEWQGGLRDGQISVNDQQHDMIAREKKTIRGIKAYVFRYHGL